MVGIGIIGVCHHDQADGMYNWRRQKETRIVLDRWRGQCSSFESRRPSDSVSTRPEYAVATMTASCESKAAGFETGGDESADEAPATVTVIVTVSSRDGMDGQPFIGLARRGHQADNP